VCNGRPVVSPVLTLLAFFHRERHLVHPALRSAVLAVEEAARHGVGCRIVAVIDRGDAFTCAQVSRFRPKLDAIHEVDFGDLSCARNHGIANVDTKYFALLDGDDLFDPDWLWKGVQFLEGRDDERIVAHAEVRLNFGAESYGRIQIGTDSPLFHPLNLIASWHYAADIIAHTALFRRLPFLPCDRAHNLGSEDWHWTCESIVEGIQHAVVPETVYFYRRQPNHVSLGSLRGFTFLPTRLLGRAMVPTLDAAYPSAAIRFADRSRGPLGDQRRWTCMPPWLEVKVGQACEIELGLYDLYRDRRAIRLETPHFYPAVGHLYLRLMAQLSEDREPIVFFCDRLAAWNLGVVEDFLAAQRQRQAPALDVLIVALAPMRDQADFQPSTMPEQAPDSPWLRLRHLDLGAEPAFAHLWEPERHSLLVRFLIQTRARLVVNLDSCFFDGLIGAFGPAVASGGTRTIRICHAHHGAEGDDGPLADWYHLLHAEGRYSVALCRNRQVADYLNGFFRASGLAVTAADRGDESAGNSSMGTALYDWQVGSAGLGLRDDTADVLALPTAASCDPDVSIVVYARREGYYLNPMFRTLAAAVADAARSGLQAEVIITTGRPGPRTKCILASLAQRWPNVRVLETDLDDEGAVLNAGVVAARGRFVALMPAGDLASPGWVAQAVRRCQEAGSDAIVHPGAVVEYGPDLRIRRQPDSQAADFDLADLAFHEIWTPHALATRELFRRIPFLRTPAASGYGHTTWHWSCETVAQGCRHLTVPETAVYRRAGGSLGESVPSLGSIEPVTLPPSHFFVSHRWLRAQALAPAGPGPDVPADWDEGSYLRSHPDVARAVEAGAFWSGYHHYRLHGWKEERQAFASSGLVGERRKCLLPPDWDEAAYLRRRPDVAQSVAAGTMPSGYAHYCLHGRQEGRSPAWTTAATADSRPPASPTQRPPLRPGWLRRGLSSGPPGFLEARGCLPPHKAPLLSRQLDEEMRTLAKVDPGLEPRQLHRLASMPLRDPWAADVYRWCWRTAAALRPTHIFVAPALRPGGAERALVFCMEAVAEDPDARLLLITTDSHENRWHHQLPPRCAWLAFPTAADGPHQQRRDVLTRLLLNSGARTLHVFYSGLGWEILRCHAPALADRLRLFVSLFYVPPVTVGIGAAYADWLGPLWPSLAGVLTDNQRAAAMLAEMHGVPHERIVALRHPVVASARPAGPHSDGTLVLWASRLDRDKRPDLLRAVAERLPGLTFHVYGSPVLDDQAEIARLRAVRNIDYRGSFAGFDSIPAAPYHCFLYTSRVDGMPNVLLEAMQAGLLVVASDVGGVSDVVDADTGLLVRAADDPSAYVAAIERTLHDGEHWRQVAANGQRRVSETFTTAAFREALRSIPGYLKGT